MDGLSYPVICGRVTGATKSGASTGATDKGFKKFIVDPNEEIVLISDPFDIAPQALSQRMIFADKSSDYCPSRTPAY